MNQEKIPDANLLRHSQDRLLNSKVSPVGPIEKPSRVVEYNDGSTRSFALLISKEMVSNTQKVINHTHKIQHYTNLLEEVESQILAYEKLLDKASADLYEGVEDQAQRLQEEIDSHESILRDASRRRDELIWDIDAFKMNLDFAKDLSHGFLKRLLEEANLLEAPPEIPQADFGPHTAAQSFMAPMAEDIGLSVEQLCERAAREKVGRLLDELTEAQREFDNMDNEYDAAKQEYKECFARGEVDMTRSEFDCRYVLSCRQITRHLIEVEEAYKDARSRALAIGTIASNFGEPDYGGFWGEWDPQSEPVEDFKARQALRDWSFVKRWLANVPDLNDQDVDERGATSIEREESAESMDNDDWDLTSIQIGESGSVIADVDMHREKISFWRNACSQLRESKWGHEDIKMQ